jgi:two-component system sensor histidine kinase VicK
MPDQSPIVTFPAYLQGGGEAGELIRLVDWSKTPLGPPEVWPAALKIAVGIMLSSPFPMHISWGNEFIQFYNDGYRPILGSKKHPQAMGISIWKSFPEIWDAVGPMFRGVMENKPVRFLDFKLFLDRNDELEECYFNFSYSPIADEYGHIQGVLTNVIETTDKVKAFSSLELAKQDVELAQAETAAQRDYLKQFFMQVPAGVCILSGPELIYELINPLYQQLFPGRKLLGKPLLEAVPEIKNQPIWQILQDVYHTGQTFEGNQLLIPLARTDDGPIEERYFNFIYQARLDVDKKVNGILVFAIEVTKMVQSVKELAKTKDNLKLAITAAQLGTFDMDLENGTMEWDLRCRELFGINHADRVTYERDFVTGLHPDDRERITKVIENVFIKSISNGDYDVEYRTVGAEDKKLRWVRAMGKAYFDEQDKPVRFVGSVLDITEQKENELRKNDFIGMVSHELKTPLTTLTAIVQVANAKLKTTEDAFLRGALDKANVQVKKMSTMINGFLNLSRLESGKIQLDLQDFYLDQLIEEMMEEIKLTVNSHHIVLSPCEPVRVCADRDKIGSVIINLVSNAVKYSPKGKEIIIDCSIRGKEVLVSIKDEGMGIKPEDITHIFDRFYRVASQHTRHISGFGIGLYLSAEIIRRHNGRIWAESEKGIGSIFNFTLPLLSS